MAFLQSIIPKCEDCDETPDYQCIDCPVGYCKFHFPGHVCGFCSECGELFCDKCSVNEKNICIVCDYKMK